MIDIFGKEIFVDDIVSFNPPKYKGLKVGKVIGFTPQKVTVAFDRYDSHNLTYDNIDNFPMDTLPTSSFFPKDICKFEVV